MSLIASYASDIANLNDPVLRNIATAAICDPGDTSGYYNREKITPSPWNIPNTNDQRHLRINRQQDFDQLHSTGVQQIKQLSRCTIEIQIPAKSTSVINTQIFHPSWYLGNPPIWYLHMSSTVQNLTVIG